jgi:hypothetical protein
MRFVIAKGTADGAAARTKMAEAITNLGEFRFSTRRHQKHHREKFYAARGLPKPRNRGNEHQTRFCFSMVQFWRKFWVARKCTASTHHQINDYYKGSKDNWRELHHIHVVRLILLPLTFINSQIPNIP